MSPAAATDVGKHLLNAGWRQGCVFTANGSVFPWLELQPDGACRMSSAPRATDELWLVTSQECDLVSPKEEHVEAMRAFWSSDRRIISNAKVSARHCVLQKDGDRSLLADARIKAHFLKTSLLHVTVSAGSSEQEPDRSRLKEWLGRRYTRPAILDAVVDAVFKPLRKKLEKLNDTRVWASLDAVAELRFQMDASGDNEVRVLALRDGATAFSDAIDGARLRGFLAETLNGESGRAKLSRLDVVTHSDISVADYLSTQRLEFDEFSEE